MIDLELERELICIEAEETDEREANGASRVIEVVSESGIRFVKGGRYAMTVAFHNHLERPVDFEASLVVYFAEKLAEGARTVAGSKLDGEVGRRQLTNRRSAIAGDRDRVRPEWLGRWRAP